MTTFYRRPADVAIVRASEGEPGESTDTVYLSHLPTGSLVVLRGTAALIWEEAVATDLGPAGLDLVERLAARVGMPPAEIREDVWAFVGELGDQGLLTAD